MRAFVESIRSASEIREQSEAKKLKAALKHQEKRYAELDILLKKVYEDNALGRLPDKRYEMLSAGYEKEQAELEQSIKTCREQLTQYDEDTDRTEEFLALVHKYTDITELTPVIINEFVDKILVHKAEKIDGERVMEIEIYLNFIGKVELPAQELTEEDTWIRREDEREHKHRQLIESMNTRPFWHYCEVCGKKEFITAKEALDAGWDYPPHFGGFGLLGPRTCGDCSLKDTLFWKVHTEFPLPIVINEQLTPEEKIIWQRIKAEPESLLEEK